MPKKKDLIGQKFGRWTVLKPAPFRISSKGYRTYYWLCKCECGKIKEVAYSSLVCGKSLSCGCIVVENCKKMSGPLHPMWAGGSYKTKYGYIRIQQPGHPRADEGNYILEHHLVMEKMIGRFLLSNENVHHINGIRDDNRPENLELWSHSQPYGQRVEDKILWAKEYLKEHGYTIVQTHKLEWAV